MLKLTRFIETQTETIGKLELKSRGQWWQLCYTLELAYNENARNVSCIPVGVYQLTKLDSSRFGETIILQNDMLNVLHSEQTNQNRYGIIAHAGNWHTDTKGCILLGYSLQGDKERIGLTHSRKACDSVLPVLREYNSLIIDEWINQRV